MIQLYTCQIFDKLCLAVYNISMTELSTDSVENTQQQDLIKQYLDDFLVDIKIADSRDEAQEDLDSLKDWITTPEMQSLQTTVDPLYSDAYQAMTAQQLQEKDPDALMAFDILLGREVILEKIFGMIQRYQNPTTKIIDREALIQEYDAMQLDTWAWFVEFGSNFSTSHEHKWLINILNGSTFSDSYFDGYIQSEVLWPIWDGVYAMIGEYNRVYGGSDSKPNGVIQDQEKLEEQVKEKWIFGIDRGTKKDKELIMQMWLLTGVVGGSIWLYKWFTGNKPFKSIFRKLVGKTWVGIVAWGSIWAMLTRFVLQLNKAKSIPIEQAVEVVLWQVNNFAESDMWRNLKAIRVEWDRVVSHGYESYIQEWLTTESTQIDLQNFKIPGRWIGELTFQNNTDLVHTANLINYIKHTYRWLCASEEPFVINETTGDIEIRVKDGNSKKKEKVVSWGHFSTLMKYMPTLNGHKQQWLLWSLRRTLIWTALGAQTDYSGRYMLKSYLESLNIWKQWTTIETLPRDERMNEVDKIAYDVQEEIRNNKEIDNQIDHRSNIRAFLVEWTTDRYNINSWGKDIEVVLDNNGTVRIKWCDIVFENIENAVKVANLTNYFTKKFWGESKYERPIKYVKEDAWDDTLYFYEDWTDTRVPYDATRMLSEKNLEEWGMYDFLSIDIEKYAEYLNNLWGWQK